MEFVLPTLFLLIGFILLIKGADYLIEGAAGLATKLHVPSVIIGLTVLAFGTSLPELVVNTFASIEDKGDITVGNVIGSNIANIGLILGTTALISVVKVKKRIVKREAPFLILTAFLIVLLFSDRKFGGIIDILSRPEAIVLLVIFMIFLYSLVMMKDVELEKETGKEERNYKHLGSLIFLGLVGISFGGDLITDNASIVAALLGLSQVLIGLTIVSIGTSLPELAASVAAARKGYADMAIGNVVGSNIFNTLLIFGVSGTIRPIVFNQNNFIDLYIMVGFSILLFLFIFRDLKISKARGVAFLTLYFSYIGYIVWRG